MARLTTERTGWGAVDHPETGEPVQLNQEVDDDVAEAIADHYDPVEAVGLDASEDADDEYNCGVNGCSRTVESEDATCWQH